MRRFGLALLLAAWAGCLLSSLAFGQANTGPIQQPAQWNYDIDPATGASRATYPGEISGTLSLVNPVFTGQSTFNAGTSGGLLVVDNATPQAQLSCIDNAAQNDRWCWQFSGTSLQLKNITNGNIAATFSKNASMDVSLAIGSTSIVNGLLTSSGLASVGTTNLGTNGAATITIAAGDTFTDNATTTNVGGTTLNASAANIHLGSGGGSAIDIIAGNTFIVSAGTQLNGLTFFGNHIASTSGATGLATACGTGPVVATGSTDTRGRVVEGGTSTGCNIPFTTAYTTAPFCTVASNSNLGISTQTISTTALQWSHASSSGSIYTWECWQ